MRSTLEELSTATFALTPIAGATAKKKQLMAYIAEHHDSLLSTLTDNQKEPLFLRKERKLGFGPLKQHPHRSPKMSVGDVCCLLQISSF